MSGSAEPTGPFSASWESLAENYRCPEWYRDAKFGIWAHWDAQCVPEDGDWYARNMYIQGMPQYEHHLKHYGHPTQFGFMEIDHLWHAENWNPEKLIDLYKRAGAKYFVALANHHDNFDCYDSKYHPWNSVRVGPHKDIIGTWEKVVRAKGLHFGVSNHSSHAWHWFQPAYGYDPVGPLAGKRYDAFHLKKSDGKGKWWEGLDPQDLYTGPNIVVPDGITSIKAMQDWHGQHDGHWYEEAPNNPGFVRNWFLRCQDLLDKYHPDFLYFDDTGLPFGQTGLDIAAHFYNSNSAFHKGDLTAVVTAKNLPPAHKPALVEDFERGVPDDIQPLPWQTDTCIGNWHYQKVIQYKTVAQVVKMLVDVVSKNGNLLLSIPVRGDGTIDDREMEFLAGLTRWMDINGEGIFGSRPWKIFGEGPSHKTGGMFSEGKTEYTAEDIRFTTRGNTLYVFTLGIPFGDIKIKSLGTASSLTQPIRQITMLGSNTPIIWHQEPDQLLIPRPTDRPTLDTTCFKVVFK
ncbi:MAG TPA: alpha-L-fucosidase [Tepidisphaeraceae bacterium]|nr:alpha-L-fucosidase [Tepidisphaeraceae bacterium]